MRRRKRCKGWVVREEESSCSFIDLHTYRVTNTLFMTIEHSHSYTFFSCSINN